MEVVFLIGNGFDLNLDLKTDFTSFLKNHYLKVENENPVIKKFKENIQSEITTWSDLEMALGAYSKCLSDYNDLILIHDNLIDELSEYLLHIESSFDFSQSIQDKMLAYLTKPFYYLTQKNYKNYQDKVGILHNVRTNIISLNYTTIIEKSIKHQVSTRRLIGHVDSYTNTLYSILHLHGYCTSRFVLGLSNDEQIANEEFRQNKEVISALIKEKANEAGQHGAEEAFNEVINNFHILYIFGTSFGPSDQYIWYKALNTLLFNTGSRIYVFWYEKDFNPKKMHKIATYEDQIKDKLLSYYNLEYNGNDAREILKERIFVTINSDIFKI